MNDERPVFHLTGLCGIVRADGSVEPLKPPAVYHFAPPPEQSPAKPIDLSDLSFTLHSGTMKWDDLRSLCAVLGLKPIRITWIRPRYGYRRARPSVN